MITILIFLLLIISLILGVMNYKKSSLSITFLTFIIFYSASSGVLPNLLLKSFEPTNHFLTQPNWGKQNVIVLLGAGTTKLISTTKIKPYIIAYSRIMTAFRLYSQCKRSGNACMILISGGDPLKKGQSEAENYRDELQLLGVSHANILIEPNSKNTYQNAQFSSLILKSHTFDKIFLVTSGIHLTRSVRYFKQFGMDVIPVQSDYMAALYSVVPRGFNFAITDLALHEYGGMVKSWF